MKTLVALSKIYLNCFSLLSLSAYKRKMIEQMPLPKSQLAKQTLVAHARKLVEKMQGSNRSKACNTYITNIAKSSYLELHEKKFAKPLRFGISAVFLSRLKSFSIFASGIWFHRELEDGILFLTA